jgi:DNA-binding NarL/FixJ family response regulator
MHDEPGYARVTQAAGAAGHVVKDSESGELLAAIRAVHRGRTFVRVGGGGHGDGDGDGAGPTPVETAAARAMPPLSPRERQVLALLAHGHTNREIAAHLTLSVKTIETHRARLSDKLGLHNRADLVRLALELGLLKR